jgi:hypothetical protein
VFENAGKNSVEAAKTLANDTLDRIVQRDVPQIVNETVNPAVQENVDEIINKLTPAVQANVDEIFEKLTPAVRANVDEIFNKLTPAVQVNVDEILKKLAPAVQASADEILKKLAPAVQASLDDVIKKMTPAVQINVDHVLGKSTPVIQANVDEILRKLAVFSEDVVKRSIVDKSLNELDPIIQRNVDQVLSKLSAFLSSEYAFLKGLERSGTLVQKVIEDISGAMDRAHTLIPVLREMVGADADTTSRDTMKSVIETTRNLRDFIEGANSLLPQLNVTLREWHEAKEREHTFGWRVLAGSTTAGLLFASFVYAIYLKVGLTVTPLRAISLFWVGISIPVMFLNARTLFDVWIKARRSRLQGELYSQLFGSANISRMIVLAVLILANAILNFVLIH